MIAWLHIPYVPRSTRWTVVPAAAVAAVVVCVVTDPTAPTGRQLVATLFLAAATAVTFDDASAGTTASAPTSPPLRRLGRVALLAVPATALWLLTSVVLLGALPPALAWLEFVTDVAVVLALAAWTAPDEPGATVALPGLAVLTFAGVWLRGPAAAPAGRRPRGGLGGGAGRGGGRRGRGQPRPR